MPQEKLIFHTLNHKEYKSDQYIVWDKCKAIIITCVIYYIFSIEILSTAVSENKHSDNKLFLFNSTTCIPLNQNTTLSVMIRRLTMICNNKMKLKVVLTK